MCISFILQSKHFFYIYKQCTLESQNNEILNDHEIVTVFKRPRNLDLRKSIRYVQKAIKVLNNFYFRNFRSEI